MSQRTLLNRIRGNRGREAATLDEYFDNEGLNAWGRLRDVARGGATDLIDHEAIVWASRRIAESPAAFFALLLDISAKDEKRREPLFRLFCERMPEYPAAALGAAGYNLHEYNRILKVEWLDVAQKYFDHDPEGAWGVFESAAMYRPKLVSDERIDWFETKRATMPRDYFVSMLSLARHWPEKAPGLLARVLSFFAEYPAAAVDGAAFAAGDVASLLTPELVAAVLRHFEAEKAKSWEFFERASRAKADLFDAGLLDALTSHTTGGPGAMFTILGHLIEAQPDRATALVDRYVAMLRAHPATGIDDARRTFHRDAIRLVRPELIRALCDGFSAAPYPAYEFLGRCVKERPELIGASEVEAAVRNISHATNWAFGFFTQLLKTRPEFTRECTLALFECLAQEPAYRAFVREEELSGIVAISEAVHVRTGLEAALREPPKVGSRRGRALMAIMFRQKLRARRHVLLEALRYGSRLVLWRKIPQTGPTPPKEDSEKFSPVWDFVMFIIDNSGDDAISTAAAERFLEGAFQLSYLCRTGAEHDEFLRKLDIGYPPPHAFPAGAEFLETEPDLTHLYRLVVELGRRFGVEPVITPLARFADRAERARQELRAIEGELTHAEGARRKTLEDRQRSLKRRLECWASADYLAAYADGEAVRHLPEDAQALLKKEKKDLKKDLRDALRAEAIRVAVSAVERSRMDLYRNRLRDILGREVEIEKLDPSILPSFLWFQAIGRLRNNTKYLRQLIEDRVGGRPHDWLRTEPPAAEWASRVRAARPEIRLERWRAPFTREFQYRPKDALAEKRRRIKADLAQARELLEKAGATGIASDSYDVLSAKLADLKAGGQPEAVRPDMGDAVNAAEAPAPSARADPALLEEIAMNLERVRIAEQTPDSDFEGKLVLSVESDPFEILFMGEYGFASCLSLRGSNAWSAVSNAIDIDKTVVWAKEPGGNVVGRRLIALLPEGVLTFRTYTNRHGLALDHAFQSFIHDYAAHCGTQVIRQGHPGALLSDQWYDDGAI
jgi:hypothetical protein